MSLQYYRTTMIIRECSYYNPQCYGIVIIMQKSHTKGWHVAAAIRCNSLGTFQDSQTFFYTIVVLLYQIPSNYIINPVVYI